MTLQGFEKNTGRKTIGVAVPLEFVDWMAMHSDRPFIQFLSRLDPYSSIRIPSEEMASAVVDLVDVQKLLRNGPRDVPRRVDLFGPYGVVEAKKTVKQMIDFFRSATENDWKVISIGD